MFNCRRCFGRFASSSLFDSLKVLRFITIFNGLMPFCKGNDGESVRTKKSFVIIAIFHYFLYIGCAIITLEEYAKMRDTFFPSKVSDFVAFMFTSCTFSSFTLLFLLSLLLRKHLLKMVQIFFKVDEIFRKLYIKPKYQNITKLTTFMVITLLSFKIAYNTSCIFLFREGSVPSIPMWIVFNLPYSYMWIYIFKYVTLVYIVKFCMQEVNRVSFFKTFF